MEIREDYNFTKAMKTLLKQEIITYDSQKGFRITKSTWKWYKDFRSNSFRRTINKTYSLRIHKSYPPKKEELIQYGSIPIMASQVLRYFLPNQTLQWRGNTYQITKIDNEYDTLYGVPLKMMESSCNSQKENPVEELIVISEVLKKREIRNISDDLTYEIILAKLTLVEQLVDIPEEKHDFIISRVKGELSVQQEMEGIICKLPMTHSEGIMSTIHRYMRLDRNLLEIKPFTSKKTPCFIILDKSELEYVHVIFDGWSEWLK